MSTFSRILRFFSKRSFNARGRALRSLAQSRGFTLVELLVVSLIIVLITAFVLFRQQGFNSATLLRSLSYGIALSVRQAQVYGVSVRESAVGSGVFAPGYGVHFGNTGLVDKSHYLIFADRLPLITSGGDGQYTPGEELPRFTIGNGRGTDYLIKSFCAHVIGGSDQCYAGFPPTSPAITSLTVYFRRPNPDACFSTNVSPTACNTATTPAVYDYAYIQIKAFTSNDYRTIKISSTGQISVCKPNIDSAGVAAC